MLPGFEQLAEVLAAVVVASCKLGSLSCAVEGAESSRLLFQSCFEFCKCSVGTICSQEHLTEQFARRRERPGCDSALLSSVFQFCRRFHPAQRFFFFALRHSRPSFDFTLLNFHLQSPVAFSSLRQLLPDLFQQCCCLICRFCFPESS